MLSRLVRLSLPPLCLSSIPKRAVGFSYPSGREGMAMGAALLGVTAAMSFLLWASIGVAGPILMTWLTGGTGALILYNSGRRKVAFLKTRCSGCRLRSVIEEHEAMHLDGVASEEAVWAEARKKYSYEGLSLAGDPQICNFCPIAKRLRSYS